MEEYLGGDVGFEVEKYEPCKLQWPPLYFLNDLCLELPYDESSAVFIKTILTAFSILSKLTVLCTGV